MATTGIFYVFAYVSDLERSKRFYGEILGWQLGTDEPGVAGFAFGTGYLIIHADNRPTAERRYQGGTHVTVRVDDVDAEHARLASLGVAVSPPCNQPWGERDFHFNDPDGYLWSYGQAK